MPGISVSRIPIPFNKGGFSYSSYWTKQNKSFWIKPDSRQETTLINELGDDAKILLPVCASKTEGYNNYILHLRTGIIPQANTVAVLRVKLNSLNMYEGADGFYCSVQDYGGMRWRFTWGDKSGLSHTNTYGTANVLADTDWHTLIVYDKRYWLLAPDISISDVDILGVISSQTPLIYITDATWTERTGDIRLLGSFDYTVQSNINYSLAYFGTISDSVITWQKKFVFTNEFAAYEIIAGTMDYFLSGAGYRFNGLNVLSMLSRSYSEYGYDLPSLGHVKGFSANRGILSVPKTAAGEFIGTLPDWFVQYNEIEGNEKNHNACDSIIEFPTGVMDRSDVTIFKDGARCRNRAIIDLSGTSGTAIITINGVAQTITFTSSLGATALNFAVAASPIYNSIGYMYRMGTALFLDSGVVSKISTLTINNTDGNLTGTVYLIGGYDSVNPTRWHISELNYLLLKDWINDDYVGMHFPVFDDNSVVEADRVLFKEFAVMEGNKSGSDLSTILKYTGDFNYV